MGIMKTYMEETQKCSCCETEKPLSAFSYRQVRGGYRTVCKVCRRSQRRTEPRRVVEGRYRCPKCEGEKSHTSFYKDPGKQSGLASWCKECVCTAAAERYQNPTEVQVEARKRVSLRSRLKAYGLTIEHYERILVTQGGGCAICSSDENLVVDHCHDTHIVRGVLCRQCNLGLGHFKDQIELLRAALSYLVGS